MLRRLRLLCCTLRPGLETRRARANAQVVSGQQLLVKGAAAQLRLALLQCLFQCCIERAILVQQLYDLLHVLFLQKHTQSHSRILVGSDVV